MPERESDQFYLDPDFILAAAKELEKSGSKADQGMSRYLQEFVAQRESRPPLASLGMAAVQTDLVRPMTTDSAFEVRSADRPNLGPSNWGIQFLKKILADLRDVICGSKKKPTELGKNAQAYIAAITIIIMQKFHLLSPTANGMAVLTILAISRATKKAFCEMTDAEVFAALKENR
jgi:hypothetical protein